MKRLFKFVFPDLEGEKLECQKEKKRPRKFGRTLEFEVCFIGFVCFFSREWLLLCLCCLWMPFAKAGCTLRSSPFKKAPSL